MYCWTVDDSQEQPYAASDTNLAAFTRRACPPYFTVEGCRRPPCPSLFNAARPSPTGKDSPLRPPRRRHRRRRSCIRSHTRFPSVEVTGSPSCGRADTCGRGG